MIDPARVKAQFFSTLAFTFTELDWYYVIAWALAWQLEGAVSIWEG